MTVVASRGRGGAVQQPTYTTAGTGDPKGAIPARWFALDDVATQLPEFDYVVLALRLDATTEHLVDPAFLRACKPSAVVVNMARGGLVDEAALGAALAAGEIGGAALDVFQTEPLPAEHPLRDAPNLLISPHCSPESPFFQREINNMVAANLRRFAAGETLLNVIRPR
jgi:phosphoglycerate dehydrogenase-like enzyme